MTETNNQAGSMSILRRRKHPMESKQDEVEGKSRVSASNNNHHLRESNRHFVEHDYHDHANDKEEDYRNLENSSSNPSSSKHSTKPATVTHKPGDPEYGDVYRAQRARGGVTIPFPLKLHRMLDTIEQDGYGEVVSWQPHGRAFLVRKPTEFVSLVMPKYFKQTKITSFQRQLNLYGFRRLTKGSDMGAYYHELFLRGRPFLCHKMTRTKIKGTGSKAASSPETEPDFYSMPYVAPQDGGMKGGDDIPSPAPSPVPTISLNPTSFQEFHRVSSRHSFTEVPSPASPKENEHPVFGCVPFKPQLPFSAHSGYVPITPDCRPTFFHQGADQRPYPLSDPAFPELPLVCKSSDVRGRGDAHSVSSGDSCFMGQDSVESDDDVVLFEGKQFHYLDSADLVSFQLSRREESVNSMQRLLPGDPHLSSTFPESDGSAFLPVANESQMNNLPPGFQEWE